MQQLDGHLLTALAIAVHWTYLQASVPATVAPVNDPACDHANVCLSVGCSRPL